jgi:REP element-mobilizing transposase RayT
MVFSNKHRAGLIQPEIEDELYGYIGGIVRNNDGKLLKAGGTANHIHLLVSMSKNHLVPDVIGAVKRDSSKWIKTKRGLLSKFAWQDGYSAFSLGFSQILAVEKYIAGQKEHHKKKAFQRRNAQILPEIRYGFRRTVRLGLVHASLTGTASLDDISSGFTRRYFLGPFQGQGEALKIPQCCGFLSIL